MAEKGQRNYHTLANLEQALATFLERNRTYGNNYHSFGKVCMALFPDGLQLKEEMDWNRFGLLIQILSKLTRYVRDPHNGHHDSMHDLGVYSFMLEEMDAVKSGWPVYQPDTEAEIATVFRQCVGKLPDNGHSIKDYCEHVYRRDTIGNMRCTVKECRAIMDGPVFAQHTHLWDTASLQEYSKCKICKMTWKEYREAMTNDCLGH